MEKISHERFVYDTVDIEAHLGLHLKIRKKAKLRR